MAVPPEPTNAAIDPASPDVAIPPPDQTAEPNGLVVLVEPGDRIHFLDWGGPVPADGRPEAEDGGPGVLLVHGLSSTAWSWAPVARRVRSRRHTVAMDLRGHGLSDAPTSGFDAETLAADVIAVAEGSGLLAWSGGAAAPDRVVLAGHGFGAIVAAWAAAALGDRCDALVMVDGGFEDYRESTGLEPDEFLRGLDEPPEVLRSLDSFLDDRRGFDPDSWDADQDRAARATIVETAAGRVVPTTRPHVLEACVKAMFDYRPLETLGRVSAPIAVLAAAENEEGTRGRSLATLQASLAEQGHVPLRVQRFPSDGHNLMRYRPVEVSAAILASTMRR
jgi:pimeloyl-ACP methyl ester carboxylesterase